MPTRSSPGVAPSAVRCHGVGGGSVGIPTSVTLNNDERPRPDGDEGVSEETSAEAVAAGAGAARVGVVDGEALLLDGVGEVDRRALEVGGAHPVDDDLHAAEVGEQVAVEGALVEVELVDEAGAATGLDTDAQAEVVATLLRQQALH